jgi:sortase A
MLIVLGALLLAYVGFEYTQMYWGQKRLQDEWAQQQERQEQQAPESDASARTVALKEDGLTRLSIPSISFDAVVVEGTSHRALLLGPGHMEDTPTPGDTGNSVISGHRDTFFRHIHELEKGDQILVQRNGKTFHYEVTGKHIVQPTDVSVLKSSKDTELTLITCYPTYYIGPAPERLVVTSRLIDDSAQSSLSPATPAMDQSAQKAIAH